MTVFYLTFSYNTVNRKYKTHNNEKKNKAFSSNLNKNCMRRKKNVTKSHSE